MVRCRRASALTAINYAQGVVSSEYYSHVVARDWYAEVRSTTADFHDKYNYTGIEAGLDPRGWAWLLWAHADPGHGYHDYWSASQARVNGWLVANLRTAAEPAGALVFRSIHGIDVVGFSSDVDPRTGASVLNGVYVVDPWFPNAPKTLTDRGILGLAPNTYLTLATWNSSYLLPYVDRRYEAVHGPNLWHNQFVVVLRAVDGTAEPTADDDAMPPRFGTGGALLGWAAIDPVSTESRTLVALRAAISRHGLDADLRLGIRRGARLELGRHVDVDSLTPDMPPYRLVEVLDRGRVVAIAMFSRVDGGFRFAGLQPLYPGNAMRDEAAVRRAFASAGVLIRGLGLAWLPSPDSFAPFSPFWVATDVHGARRYLTPAGSVVVAPAPPLGH